MGIDSNHGPLLLLILLYKNENNEFSLSHYKRLLEKIIYWLFDEKPILTLLIHHTCHLTSLTDVLEFGDCAHWTQWACGNIAANDFLCGVIAGAEKSPVVKLIALLC